MKLIIGGLDVSEYFQQSGIAENMEKVYDSANQFTTADGRDIRFCLGVRKSYSIKLGNVPLNVKNMLRSRSRYGYISCTVGAVTEQFTLDSFSAQVIIQNDTLNLWTVSFTLSAKKVEMGASGDWGIYSVTCDGLTFTMKDGDIVGDIKIVNTAGGMPTSGISASQLTFSLDVSRYGIDFLTFSPSAVCKVGSFIAPTYYITGRSLNDGVLTITATDRTIFLDLPFNYTGLDHWKDKDGFVPTDVVIQNIAHQAGFLGFGYGSIPNILPKMPYADLASSCRSLLDVMAKLACGVWYCTEDDKIMFYDFLGENYSGVCTLADNERTDVRKGIVRGPYSGVLLINESTDSGDAEQFTAGNVESAYAAVKISSKYASGEACGKLYERIDGRSFKTFSISRGFVYNFMPVGSRVITDINTMESYVATNITHYLSAASAYAELSAEAPTESEWDFSGALTQQVNKRIAESVKYHGVALSKKEGLTCDGVGGKITMADGEVKYYSKPSGTASDTPAVAALSDGTETSVGSGAAAVEKQRCITIRDGRIIFSLVPDDGKQEEIGSIEPLSLTGNDNTAAAASVEEYGLTVESGGYTQYDGIMSSGKEAKSVAVDTENNTVKVDFVDGHSYEYSADVEKNGSTYTITNEKGTWK